MNVVVLNGSPKGEKGVTLQYVRYLEKHLEGHQFRTFHVSRDIHGIEKNPATLEPIIEAVKAADLVAWCTPVYYLLVPGQMKRFHEILVERGLTGHFEGKYATAFTTSVHFFDHTAHDYLRAFCEDMGMLHLGGYSAHYQDLLKEQGRHDLVTFGRYVATCVEKRWPVDRQFGPVSFSPPRYEPGPVEQARKTDSKKIVLLTDAREQDANLTSMTRALVDLLPNPVDVVNLHTIDMRGGCLGCCRCAYDNTCCYKDGLAATALARLYPADILFFCGTIRDRFLSARWKTFLDRLFFNGHRPTTAGKVIGFLVSGPLGQNAPLRQVLEAISDVGRMTCAGFVTDERGDSAAITQRLSALADRTMWIARERLVTPRTFLGTGGHMVFRDLVSELSWFFRSDHRFYRENGLFDYPEKTLARYWQSLFMSVLIAFDRTRDSVYKGAVDHMVAPYLRIVDRE
ncbi:MAG: NAD(P)H-dependent oxidoreductase [Candidatus Riflebacteria bacterium]|nr:NAD(P)H-dependent oxidoreductase [Candidatus Riflebacteria bacterium]